MTNKHYSVLTCDSCLVTTSLPTPRTHDGACCSHNYEKSIALAICSRTRLAGASACRSTTLLL